MLDFIIAFCIMGTMNTLDAQILTPLDTDYSVTLSRKRGVFSLAEFPLLNTKQCSKCKINKPLWQFSKYKDGHQRWCKECAEKHKKTPAGIKALRKYAETHKEELRERGKIYCETYPEKTQVSKEKYRISHREELREYQNTYYRTEQGKINVTRCLTERKRDLGFNPLNSPKPNYDGHHINNLDVIYIPTKIHAKFHTGDRKKHRKLVLEYYGSVENMIINKKEIVK